MCLAAICHLKSLGHHVTTTCSERNSEWCRRMGADALVDHTKAKWYETLEPNSVDAVFQAVGSAGDYDNAHRVLRPHGVFATCDSETPVAAFGRKLFSSKFFYYLNKPSSANLHKTVEAIEAAGDKWPNNLGHLFEFAEADKAFTLSRSGKATGKIVIKIE
jgi:NADPH:quinone reductase-like Zn-dependent oxidoreductase